MLVLATFPQELLLKAAKALLIALALIGLGLFIGLRVGHASAMADQAKALAQAEAQQRLQLNLARQQGQVAVAQLQTDLAAASTYRKLLETRLLHARSAASLRTTNRLVGRAPAWPKPVAGSAGGGLLGGTVFDAGVGLDRSPVPGRVADGAQASGGGGDGGLGAGIDLGYLSLWNSALAGVDMPAGACRPDDLSAPACAADAGIDLGEVWLNHIDNASACEQDRIRHRRLIDFLQQREGDQP